jgi:hypothetical protein
VDGWTFTDDPDNDQTVMDNMAAMLRMCRERRPHTKWGLWNGPIGGEYRLRTWADHGTYNNYYATKGGVNAGGATYDHISRRIQYDVNDDGSLVWPSDLLSQLDYAMPAIYAGADLLSGVTGYTLAEGFLYACRRSVQACKSLGIDVFPIVWDKEDNSVVVPASITDLYSGLPGLIDDPDVRKVALWTNETGWSATTPVAISLNVVEMLGLT